MSSSSQNWGSQQWSDQAWQDWRGWQRWDGWQQWGDQGWQDLPQRGDQGWQDLPRYKSGSGHDVDMNVTFPVHQHDKQTQDTQHFLPEETMHMAFPLGYNECEEMVPGFWGDVRKMADDLGCRVSHHKRKSMANRMGGWGKNKLTFAGTNAPEVANHFFRLLSTAGFDVNSVEMPQWAERPAGATVLKLASQSVVNLLSSQTCQQNCVVWLKPKVDKKNHCHP